MERIEPLTIINDIVFLATQQCENATGACIDNIIYISEPMGQILHGAYQIAESSTYHAIETARISNPFKSRIIMMKRDKEVLNDDDDEVLNDDDDEFEVIPNENKENELVPTYSHIFENFDKDYVSKQKIIRTFTDDTNDLKIFTDVSNVNDDDFQIVY